MKLEEPGVKRTRRVAAGSELGARPSLSSPEPPDTEAMNKAEEKIIGRQRLDWASGEKRDDAAGLLNSTGRQVEEKDCFFEKRTPEVAENKGVAPATEKTNPGIGNRSRVFY